MYTENEANEIMVYLRAYDNAHAHWNAPSFICGNGAVRTKPICPMTETPMKVMPAHSCGNPLSLRDAFQGKAIALARVLKLSTASPMYIRRHDATIRRKLSFLYNFCSL